MRSELDFRSEIDGAGTSGSNGISGAMQRGGKECFRYVVSRGLGEYVSRLLVSGNGAGKGDGLRGRWEGNGRHGKMASRHDSASNRNATRFIHAVTSNDDLRVNALHSRIVK